MNSSWKRMKLGDVIQKSESINPKNNPDYIFEYIDVSSVCNKKFVIQKTSPITGKDAPSRARRLVKAGDIIFATVRPTLKRIAQVPNNLDGQICSTGFFVFRPKDFIDSRFLFYFLLTDNFIGAMEQLQKGTSYPAVNDGEVKSQYIAIPPLSEQQRIVAILDEVFEEIDRAIGNTEKNLANAREVFESYLNGIFTQKGDGWVEKKLGKISAINYGYTAKASQSAIGPKFLRITDIQNNRVNWDAVPYCKISSKDYIKHKINTGDIVFARTGATTGKSFIVINPPDAVCASYLIRLSLQNNEVMPEFIRLFFQTKQYWQTINIGISGSAQGGFNASKLANVIVPIPNNIEQALIVNQAHKLFTQTQRTEAICKQKLAALQELKQSILQKAFTGELTADAANQAIQTAKEIVAT